MIQYFLMHKDQECGTLILDEKFGRILEYHDNRNGISPYLGTADIEKIRQWWELRAIPNFHLNKQTTDCNNAKVYLAKNLGLSITDTYWIKPVEVNLSFDDVKFTNSKSPFDPNASLGGQMKKHWDLTQKTPTLVKKSSNYLGQQCINEVFATVLHERQGTTIPFVRYTISSVDRTQRKCFSQECKCNAFTSEHIEFVSAHEVLESQKTRNEQSLYDKFISICESNNIDVRDFIDYQIMTDFIINNTDRHFLNFGVLMDTSTMKLIGTAPIFDSGNSMFFNDDRKIVHTRVSMLKQQISGFYKTEEKILKKVKNHNLVNADLLPTPSEVKEFYSNAGIPEEKSSIISKNYEIKLQLFSEFQKGKTISLYNERRK